MRRFYAHILRRLFTQWTGGICVFNGAADSMSFSAFLRAVISAVNIFTKTLKPVAAFLRKHEMVVFYLDGILVMHQDDRALSVLTQKIIELLTSFGFS